MRTGNCLFIAKLSGHCEISANIVPIKCEINKIRAI